MRNARAEEQQYLVILKRAASVPDVLEVTSKLAEVRSHIDELQTTLNSLHNEVEMSLLSINVTAMADAQVFGIRWRPLYKAKLALRGALSAVADYGDSMVTSSGRHQWRQTSAPSEAASAGHPSAAHNASL